LPLSLDQALPFPAKFIGVLVLSMAVLVLESAVGSFVG